MKRRGLNRILLTLLVLAALLVGYRMIVGAPEPDGLVVFVDLHTRQLEHAAFELREPAEVVVQATGSFDAEAMPVGLATQGWIVRRADRKVVWHMDPGTVERGRGNIAHVRGDTFALKAGIYDVYYATYGQAKTRKRQRWHNDADKWQFVLRLTDETASARLLPNQRLDRIEDETANLIWKTSPMRNNQEQSYLFEVKQRTLLEIYAVGEIDEEPQDYAWIEDAGTGARIWGMTRDNTEPAGGLASNRQFRGKLTLLPGTYRAVAKTNRRHAYRSWDANPPYNPAAWGLALYASDTDAITSFDPWHSREPIVSFTRVPNSAERDQRFEVEQPIHVVIYAVGEIDERRPHNLYDYGELLKEESDRKRSVWKMSWEASDNAGGGEKNRFEVAFLRLEPGIYSFHYKTDGSHSFEGWNTHAPPDYPERWGATLFPMAATLDSDVVRVLHWDAPNVAVEHGGDAIISWTRLRGEAEKSRVFELDKEAKLHIVALGEITPNGNQYDYGWIKQIDSGEIVWEMELDNTHPAGGTVKNRRFDGVVTLPPGQYVVHYKTDNSHHYQDFNEERPEDPKAWGITIHYVAEEANVAQEQ